MVWEWSCKT